MVRIEVIDLHGKVCLSSPNGMGTKELMNVGALPKGIYMVSVTLENGAVVVKKLIKQ